MELPEPFRHEPFTLHRQGISDDPEVSVYLNAGRDFAFLFPQPEADYRHYRPRVQRLGLNEYRTRNQVVEHRFRKIGSYLRGRAHVLEIGAADGAFLRHAQQANGELCVASLEVDAASRPERDRFGGLTQYADFAEVLAGGLRFDVVCFFHVLEHILEPQAFLRQCRAVLATSGILIIEVPSLDDPLLTLYDVPEYGAFYFQKQHPYVYSGRSLGRLVEANGLRVVRCLPHQRYGLENHLTWLGQRRPGGDEALRAMLAGADGAYRECLEQAGASDAVMMIADEGA